MEYSANVLSAEEKSSIPRFPVRWRWTMLVGGVVMAAVVVLSLLLLDLERTAWLESQDEQALTLVERLGDSLKLPMLSGSLAEVDVMVNSLLASTPAVVGVYVHYADANTNGTTAADGSKQTKKAQLFGKITPEMLTQEFTYQPDSKQQMAQRLDLAELWYAKPVVYDDTLLGYVAVRYSEDAWATLARQLLLRLSLAALLVMILAGAAVYWIAGKMSKPLEELAYAASEVAEGHLNVQLLEQGNDEISDAMQQFNHMVRELKHKEELRDKVGRYLNPKLVDDMFKGGESLTENKKQEVTVLFADMVSFTSFSESLAPEEVVEVLNQYFEVFNSVIHYFGGHVDKYIGDAVMAVFNHPKENSEHVRYATMAGLGMTIACEKLGVLRKDGARVSFRVGLNQGEVIVGHIGSQERLEYTVIGDAVNVASRMGGLGAGGELVMPYETFSNIGEGFTFEEMGEMDVKGVSQPVRVGRVTPASETMRREITVAVALAFDETLPSQIRMKLKDDA